MEQVSSSKFTRPVYTCADGVRFATPEIVARYRARRLKTNILADISCGIGGQTVFFAQQCDLVYGIELNKNKLECACKNAALYGVDNVTFIEGDALSPGVVKQMSDAQIIFCDPSRPKTEHVRNTDILQPGISEVLNAYRDITNSVVFEAPPQIPPERIKFECECEYLSVNSKLNRLTLYFGQLMKCGRSAVVLEGDKYYPLRSDDKKLISNADKMGIYAFEPDPAVVKAGLLGELADELGQKVDYISIDSRRSLLTSDILLDSPFIKNRYVVLDKVPFECGVINRSLFDLGIGRALIRFNVAPRQYWELRNRVERGLMGERTAHLFRLQDGIYILERI
jgi:precorrin-6B methylase 2